MSFGGKGLYPWKESTFTCMYSNDHLDFAPFEEFGTQEEVQPFRMAACVKAAKFAKFRATSQELDYCDIFVSIFFCIRIHKKTYSFV